MKIEFAVFPDLSTPWDGERFWLTPEQIEDVYFVTHEIRAANSDRKQEKNGSNFTIVKYNKFDLSKKPSGRAFEKVYRKKENISGIYGICIDIDNHLQDAIKVTKEEVKDALSGYRYILHTTHNHKRDPDSPERYRIVMFYDRIATIEEHSKIVDVMIGKFTNRVQIDKASSKDVARAWLLPSCVETHKEYAQIFKVAGNVIDVDKESDSWIEPEDDIPINHWAIGAEKEPDKSITGSYLDLKLTRDGTAPVPATMSDHHFDFNNSDHTNTDDKQKNEHVNTNSKNNIKEALPFRKKYQYVYDLTPDVKDTQIRILNVLQDPLMHVKYFKGERYADWIKIGSAIKGAGLPFDVFNEWCAMDQTAYPGAGEIFKKWESFTKLANAGSIFDCAKHRGVKNYLGYKYHKDTLRNLSFKVYDYETEGQMPQGYVTFEESLLIEPYEDGDHRFFEHICKEAPDPIAMWMEYVLETSLIELPIFALASGLATLGSIMHRRYILESPYYTCSNVYIIGLADSGTGKNHAAACAGSLYKELGLLQRGMLQEKLPASPEGLYGAMEDTNGSLFFVSREFQSDFLGQATSKQANTSIQGVASELTDLYSKSNESLVIPSRAVKEKKPKIKLSYPHLTLYGTCVPKVFYQYYNTALGVNGFLGRMMTFIMPNEFVPRKTACRDRGDIPRNLLNFCRKILDENESRIGKIKAEFKPDKIQFEAGLLDRITEAADYWSRQGVEALKNTGDDKLKAIYNRIVENALKVALISHEGNIVSKKVWEWSLNVSTQCTASLIKNGIAKSGQNQYQNDFYAIYNVIIDARGWISKEELARRAPSSITRDLRDRIIQHLLDKGSIFYREVRTKGRARIEYIAPKR